VDEGSELADAFIIEDLRMVADNVSRAVIGRLQSWHQAFTHQCSCNDLRAPR